jgi:hypothetical protein
MTSVGVESICGVMTRDAVRGATSCRPTWMMRFATLVTSAAFGRFQTALATCSCSASLMSFETSKVW